MILILLAPPLLAISLIITIYALTKPEKKDGVYRRYSGFWFFD